MSFHLTSLSFTFLIWKLRGLPWTIPENPPRWRSESTRNVDSVDTVKVAAPIHTVNPHSEAQVQCSLWSGSSHTRGHGVICKGNSLLNVLAACAKRREEVGFFLMGQIRPAQAPTSFPFAPVPWTLLSLFVVCFSKHFKSFYGVKWGRKYFETFGCCLLPWVSCPPTHVFLASCFPSLSYIGFIFFLPNTQLFALPAVWEHPSGGLTLLFQ